MKSYDHVTQQDYENIAGPDWPSFDRFQQQDRIPDFVYQEIDDMLRPSPKSSHPSFCVLPFYAMELPKRKHCCLIPNKIYDITSIRQQMLAGQRPTECSACWRLEDAGQRSDRQLKNSMLDFYLDKDLDRVIEDCRSGKYEVISYKIDTSNTCNAACVTCNSGLSSTWGQLENKHGIQPRKNWRYQPETDINYATARSITFRGGEPLLSAANFDVLERLLEQGNTECFVGFVTNGSVRPNDSQLRLLKRFKAVNFCYSIDGTGAVFEYLRWPLNWITLINNIDWARGQGFIVSANHTLSNVNLMYYKQTVQWFVENDIDWHVTEVEGPPYLSPRSLSAQIKQRLSVQHPDLLNTGWLAHSPGDDNNFQLFLQIIAQQDRMKKISIKDYLPEFSDLLGLYQS